MRQLSTTDLQVGIPLKHSCYDRNGHLLLRKGVVVTYQQQIDRLINEGLFVSEVANENLVDDKKGESVFDRISAIPSGLRTLFSDLIGGSPATDTAERLNARAHRIIDATTADPQAAIAAIHLDHKQTYLVAHHAYAAVICALLGRRLELDNATLTSLVCAGLTFDIGLIDLPYQDSYETGRNDNQIKVLRVHPQRALSFLAAANINDTVWTETIQQHHERIDGSGYPKGLSGENIRIGARILAIADAYTAMILPRPNRQARLPLQAHGELYRHVKTRYDERICIALIKEMGMYPPGSIVKLTNGEIAVVKQKEPLGEGIAVMSVYDARGMPFLAPQRRSTADERYAIAKPLPMEECRSASVIIRRIWV